MRRRLLSWTIVAGLAACSSAGDDAATDTTTPGSSLPSSECEVLARAAVAPLQEFVDRYDAVMVAEWNALDPPPDVGSAREAVAANGRAAVARGCDPAAIEAGIDEAIADLDSDGDVGAAIVSALVGEEPGESLPLENTGSVIVRPGDDVAEILADVADGSTVEFAAGVHELDETILIESGVRLVGAGRDTTTIRSAAEGAAVVFLGSGSLAMDDLTVEHVGDAAASVLLAIGGPVALRRTVLRGGVAGRAGDGGGHGLVFAFEQLPGFPELTDAERAGELEVVDSRIVDNAAAGVLLSGDARPTITGSRIAGNGECGLCYGGEAGGTVIDSAVEDNRIGVQADGDAEVTVSGTTIADNVDAGLSIDDAARLELSDSEIVGNGAVGVQVGGSSTSRLEENLIDEQRVGVLATDDVDLALRRNVVSNGDVGVQVDGRGVFEIVENRIRSTGRAALRLEGEVTGDVRDNTLEDVPVAGIQVGGSAAPEITGTVLSGPGEVGFSFAGDAAGSVTNNSIGGRDIGMQVAGRAAPLISANSIVGSIMVGILYGQDAAGTATGNDIDGADSFRIVVGGNSTPEVRDNQLNGGEVVRDPGP